MSVTTDSILVRDGKLAATDVDGCAVVLSWMRARISISTTWRAKSGACLPRRAASMIFSAASRNSTASTLRH